MREGSAGRALPEDRRRTTPASRRLQPTREEQPREPVAQERLTPPSPPSSLRRDEDEPHIPSAKERLSAAFSHDIPHDVLERRPGTTAARGAAHGPRKDARFPFCA